MRVLALALSALLLSACPQDDEVEWVRFNQETDTLEVEVTPEPASTDPVGTDLHSTSGAVVVGEATVDPGAGPVGTEHDVLVLVADTWERDVERVTVSVDAGERGVEEFELSRDSADLGRWYATLTSAGTEGEERTDVFTFALWTEGDVTASDPDTGSDTDTDTDTGSDTDAAGGR